MDILSVCCSQVFNSAVFLDMVRCSFVRRTDVSAHDSVYFGKSRSHVSRKKSFFLYITMQIVVLQQHTLLSAFHEPFDAQRRTLSLSLWRRVFGSIPERSIIRGGQLWPFFSETFGFFCLFR